MSTKQRNTIPQIDLTDKAYQFLNSMMVKKKVSQANYINECLLFVKRVNEQLRSCPDSYIALNLDESEVTTIRTDNI